MAEILRARITEGALVPGTRLSEEHIGAALGVSRNTLRESFRLLIHERPVVAGPAPLPPDEVFCHYPSIDGKLSSWEVRMRHRMFTLAGAGLLLAAAVLVPATPAAAAPTFKVPFPCGQSWSGQTRTDHSPAYAIDLNRTDDLGDPVVASAPGTVDVVADLGGTSYGKYVRINHGSGYTTYYAHLNSFNTAVGRTVGYGSVIGYVGSTGGSTGPHLHYEQRLNGSAIQVRFNGALALYWGTKTYTSDNACSGSNTGAGTVNTAGSPLTVRSGPGTGYTAVGTVADGTRVTIYCQTTGTSVTGTYGTSNIWDRIGTGRFISDAYVYTGYDGFIPGVPRC